MPEFNKSAYDQAYRRAHTVTKTLQLNREHDADIIRFFETLDEPYAAYLKRIIREDIGRRKK